MRWFWMCLILLMLAGCAEITSFLIGSASNLTAHLLMEYKNKPDCKHVLVVENGEVVLVKEDKNCKEEE